MSRRRPSPSTDPVTMTRAIGGVRVAVGLGLLLLPGLWSRLLGGVPPREDTRSAARGVGGRDLAMGLGALLAVRDGTTSEVRRWAATGAVADGLDVVALLRARDLRPLPRVLAATTALAAASAGGFAARRLPR